MIKSLEEKLEAVDNLRSYTKEIVSLSPKTNFNEINSMIEHRQKYEEILSLINEKIENLKFTGNYCEDSLIIKDIKEDITESIKQTIAMDKEIRRKINDELKNTREDLNKPEKTLKLSIKA